MSRFLSANYRKLVPYTPGEQINEEFIKLNTNESPFPPSPKVKTVIDDALIDRLRLYSDPEVKKLNSAIAQQFGLSSSRVIVGNGSDDVLAFSIMAFCGRGGKLCCPDITYGFYPVYADLFGVELEQIPLENDFTLNVKNYIDKGKNIVIANPNAPTGLAISVEDVERIVKSNPDNIVIIDEAYMAFCKQSCVQLLDKYDNLIVVRTFSKSHSLAGLRVGFALASEAIIADLNKIKYSFNPYNMNSLSIEAASVAIEDNKYYIKKIDEIISIREKAKKDLASLGFEGTDSQANFLFVTHKDFSAEQLYAELRRRKILVRYFSKPRIDKYLRITVGSSEQMGALVAALKEIIGG